ncbi:MAG: 2-oxoacid:acceptor oxidoreductase family protein [Bdellovibrionales bacterium]|jgi:pyruvate ferredoxin oxidoreductase gamma subunit|nr:2-oxoacid:acceptor oxidoreductase family protein [Bdellovibrionales bacterium]
MFSFLFPQSKPAPRTKARTDLAIRMEAIGGQGANSAGKILAEAAVLGMSYNGNHFSSFGSEKRGTPVRSFVRLSTIGHEVRNASGIRHPHLLVIFHESLLTTHPEILDGLSDESDVIVNSPKKARHLKFPKGVTMRSLTTLDARALSKKHGLSTSSLNAAMLGACVPLLPEIPQETLEKHFMIFFERLPGPLREANRSVFQEAAASAKPAKLRANQNEALTVANLVAALPKLGYSNAPAGGLVTNPGNSVLKDNSASRKGTAPKLDRELCFHCGYCDMVCPDFCFSWEKAADGSARLKGIDYQYCKGCQKCVEACPVNALKPVPEGEISAEDRNLRLFPEVSREAIETQWQSSQWQTVDWAARHEHE